MRFFTLRDITLIGIIVGAIIAAATSSDPAPEQANPAARPGEPGYRRQFDPRFGKPFTVSDFTEEELPRAK